MAAFLDAIGLVSGALGVVSVSLSFSIILDLDTIVAFDQGLMVLSSSRWIISLATLVLPEQL